MEGLSYSNWHETERPSCLRSLKNIFINCHIIILLHHGAFIYFPLYFYWSVYLNTPKELGGIGIWMRRSPHTYSSTGNNDITVSQDCDVWYDGRCTHMDRKLQYAQITHNPQRSQDGLFWSCALNGVFPLACQIWLHL